MCCMLCVMCMRWPIGVYFASLEAGMSFVMRFVGWAMQPAFPEGRLVDVAVVGPVRRPPEIRYRSIDGIKRINVYIILC